MKIDDAITSVLSRLDDEAAEVWSRSEIDLYVRDGYDTLCRRTRCLFDQTVIPNEPQLGSFGTDLQKYLAQQRPGTRIADRHMHFSQTPEGNLVVGGAYADSYDGPTTPGKD